MRRSKHRTAYAVSCPNCMSRAQQDALFGRSYIEQMSLSDKYDKEHAKALKRMERNEAMRDLGLTRVKGALGGTYWE